MIINRLTNTSCEPHLQYIIMTTVPHRLLYWFNLIIDNCIRSLLATMLIALYGETYPLSESRKSASLKSIQSN